MVTTPKREGTISERVKATVIEKLSVDETKVTEDANFVDDLNADSLDLVELIMALEEEFSTDGNPLEIPDEDATKIATVIEVVAYLNDHGIKDE